jgi:acetylornithine deacetylase/succinyl-diaminopimelate desuccinylase-like protein
MADTPTPVDLCRDLIRFDTTNHGNGNAAGERAAAEYVAGHLTAAGLDPVLLERSPGRSNVLTRIPGANPHLPAILAHAHLDVVPADPADWTVPPFAGELRDGRLYGRGATDMKDVCAMLLTVAHRWAASNTRPQRDIVLAFVADEEDRGIDGAEWLVDKHPDLFEGVAAAISETGGYTHHVNGTHLYPVATAERGTAHLRLTARGRAGHGSRPNTDNAVTHLVHTLARIADHPWPVRLTPTVRAYLERTGKALGIPVELTDDAGVDATIAALGEAGMIAATTVRASSTPTVLDAGYKVNVIPSTATAQIDVRTLPGIEDEVLATIDELLGPYITREFVAHQTPVEAPIDSDWFDAMAAALRAEDPDAVVVPYCMGGGTDAKAFTKLGIDCFGFAPLLLPPDYDYRVQAHGVDEHIPVDALEFGTRVLSHFLQK